MPGRTLLAALLLTTGLPAVAAAQRNTVPRPRLEAAADTNDAAAYYSFGTAKLLTDTRQAGNAFYWAQRLDPTRPEPYYGQRIAILLQNPRRLEGYMAGTRSVLRSKEVVEADSLFRRALLLSPLMYREFDRHLLDGYIKEIIRQITAQNPSARTGDLDHYMNQVLSRSSPDFRGWLAYTERRFPQALDLYATALKEARRKASLHADRAHIYYLVGNFDAAAQEMDLALTDMRRNDRDSRVFLYESKEFYELGYGMILEAQGRREDAIAAYGRALQEDLSYYPAHRRSASLALAAGDTAGALSSLALAAEIESADASVLLDYSALLTATGQAASAIPYLQRVIALEPYYAVPHLLLGEALEADGRAGEAIAAYETFLARSSRSQLHRGRATERLQALRAAGGSRP